MKGIEAARWAAGQRFGKLSGCPYREGCRKDNCGCQLYAEQVISAYLAAEGAVMVPVEPPRGMLDKMAAAAYESQYPVNKVPLWDKWEKLPAGDKMRHSSGMRRAYHAMFAAAPKEG